MADVAAPARRGVKEPPRIARRRVSGAQIYNTSAVALAVLLPLSLTIVQWERERTRTDLEARTQFEFRARETTEAIRGRMLAYEQLLRGAAALVANDPRVTREDWRDYARLLQIPNAHPGVVAVVYAPLVAANRLDEFVADIRNADMADYRIWPPAVRPSLAPALYIEPYSEANLRALGFDLYSEPTRAAALDIARDTGRPTLSGPIDLTQDPADSGGQGVAMYAPVYRRGADPGALEQRRTALVGFVGAAIRASDLIDDLLASRHKLDLQLFDGKPNAPTAPLAQRNSRTPASPIPKLTTEFQLELGNRTWTLSYASTPEFERLTESDRPELVLVSGLLLSGALIALIWSLASTRNRALRLARSMTAELRVKQEALKESEERLGLALQGSDLALFDWDLSTGNVRLSERWSALLGDAPHATTITMTDLNRLVHPDDLPRLQRELNAVLNGESEIYEVEHRVKNRAGEWVWILSRAKVAERDAGGRPVRITGTNSDITARKLVEQMKTDFVATVSHELRTPLTVIVGALGLLKEELTAPTPEQKMMLGMASENSARLQSLVNDMLDFEKITSGAAAFDVQPVALAPFVARALDLNRGYADRFKVRYELSGPLPAVSLQADPERLTQVLTNLLSNAAKFSPEGAVVTVDAAVTDDWVRVSVTDRGPGVPAGFRARIFEKFAQADSSDARRKGGTGLGLSISKAIVEKLGGRIGFESEPGQGATFYFELPRTQEPPQASRARFDVT